MNEDPPSPPPTRSWLDRISQLVSGEPRNIDELLEELRSAQANGLLSDDTLSMVEGAIEVADLHVGDAMIPRAQMVSLPVDASFDELLRRVVESGHSRFPVHSDDHDDIIGILLAKDLLKLQRAPELNLRALLRPAVFVPESKGLNDLLREFRGNRNHLAVVVDEFGRIAGLITIEDVLEQIVGEIEDEYDFDEASDNIIPEPGGRFRVKALTQIADFNAAFGAHFSDEASDTVGGVVIAHLGRLPKRGETVTIEGLRFQVLRADSRRVYTLLVDKPRDLR
jgi:magnesium and cobalt transporter